MIQRGPKSSLFSVTNIWLQYALRLHRRRARKLRSFVGICSLNMRAIPLPRDPDRVHGVHHRVNVSFQKIALRVSYHQKYQPGRATILRFEPNLLPLLFKCSFFVLAQADYACKVLHRAPAHERLRPGSDPSFRDHRRRV